MRVEDPELVGRIEALWSPPDGFLFELRAGLFDPGAFERLIELFRTIEDPAGSVLPRRIVSLLWYIPTFVGWQRERVAEAEGDLAAFGRAEVQIMNELERLLGVP